MNYFDIYRDMYNYYSDTSFYNPPKRTLTENQMRVKRIKKKTKKRKGKKRR